jgi:hypothetical protein
MMDKLEAFLTFMLICQAAVVFVVAFGFWRMMWIDWRAGRITRTLGDKLQNCHLHLSPRHVTVAGQNAFANPYLRKRQ